MNRIDKTVVFHPLGSEELRSILTLELNAVQERVLSAVSAPFVLTVTEPARAFLLREGTDLKYGARHLKRAIERYLVNPLSNLMATGQVGGGDVVRVDFDEAREQLSFFNDGGRTAATVLSRMASPIGGSISSFDKRCDERPAGLVQSALHQAVAETLKRGGVEPASPWVR